jgi:Domain of unknown function (DUF4349)
MGTVRRTPANHGGVLALVVGILLVTACASAGTGGAFPGGGAPGASAGAAAGGGAAGRNQDSGGATGAPSVGKGGTQNQYGGPEPAAPRAEVLVVKTGTLTLEVSDLSVLVKARTAIVGVGGYVSGSQQSSGGDQKVASVTYRIPADRWDAALDALKALGMKLVGEQTQAVEVTGAVLDLGARIDNLRASERQLQGIMARATKISEILEVQARLSDVRGQIEQLSTEKAHLEEQAAYGTLTVTWEVPVVPVQQVSRNWDAGAQVEQAFAQLVGLGQGVATVAIWFAIVLLPILLAGALALGIAALVARRLGLLPRREPGTVA